MYLTPATNPLRFPWSSSIGDLRSLIVLFRNSVATLFLIVFARVCTNLRVDDSRYGEESSCDTLMLQRGKRRRRGRTSICDIFHFLTSSWITSSNYCSSLKINYCCCMSLIIIHEDWKLESRFIAESARMKKSIVNWELIIVSNVTILLKKLVKVELNHFWKLMWNLIKIFALIAKIFWDSYKYKW